MRIFTGLSLALCLATSTLLAEKPAESDVTVLYDGGDLSAWEGRSDLWSAENAIETMEKTTKAVLQPLLWFRLTALATLSIAFD